MAILLTLQYILYLLTERRGNLLGAVIRHFYQCYFFSLAFTRTTYFLFVKALVLAALSCFVAFDEVEESRGYTHTYSWAGKEVRAGQASAYAHVICGSRRRMG